MSTQIATVQDVEKMAIAIAKSGLFGVKNPEQAFALMLVAQAEGFSPAIAARDYHIISGRPTLKSDAMLARFQTAGGSIKWKELTESKAIATFSHPQGGSVDISWTIDMAKKAGLLKNPTWNAYPRSMLRARCISEGIRTVFPGVVAGYYTPEEVEDFPTAPSEPRDITPTVEPVPAKKTSRLAAIVEAQPEVIGEPLYDIGSDLTAMRECEDMDALKDVFSKAWNACPQDLRHELKAVYDEKKEALTVVVDEPSNVDEDAPV